MSWRAWTAAAIAGASLAGTGIDDRATIGDRAMQLTRASVWTLAATVPVGFQTHHPQGMVRIGDTYFVSAVDKTKGQGHLFKIDARGALLADLPLGEGALYHPGGIDFDGTNIWVPVAQYRPDSSSIIYRVDPAGMKATEVFRFADHIGAIVHDTEDGSLHGVSWGSRRFYRWTLGPGGKVTNGAIPPEKLRTLNSSHYVDYQDCKYAGRRRMLCTGVAEIRQARDAAPFRLGGVELVDLRDGRPLHQTPVLLWTPGGMDMTHNPAWFESTATGLRAYFMPEDDKSTIYIYDVDAK